MTTKAFSEENRKTYMTESINSLDAILNDALLGEDQNEIRSEFPPKCNREDIKIENTRVGLMYLNEAEEAIIEVLIQISFEENAIGEYKSVYNINGELEDEFFTLE